MKKIFNIAYGAFVFFALVDITIVTIIFYLIYKILKHFGIL